jgi:lia operon protein LiaF
MARKPALWVGGAMIALGIIFFIGTLSQINVWEYIWPILFIGLGLVLILRPRLMGDQTNVDFHLLGDVDVNGAWRVEDKVIWNLIGDTNLDFSLAEFPQGETTIRVMGFIGDVNVRVPEAVGVLVSGTGFIVDGNIFGEKNSGFLAPVDAASENYSSAECRLRVETGYFIHDLKLERSL